MVRSSPMTDLINRTIAILRINDDRWHALATGLDRDLLMRPPAPGEWSALQCLGHATDTEAAVFAARVRALEAGQAVLASFDPDAESTPITADTDPVALAERHAALRAASLALLATVAETDLERTARHAELGPVTLRQLLNEWAAHDLMHIVQAERAVMQAFIPNSGPWRGSFADHDVDVSMADAPT
jgi:DinB superfamily